MSAPASFTQIQERRTVMNHAVSGLGGCVGLFCRGFFGRGGGRGGGGCCLFLVLLGGDVFVYIYICFSSHSFSFSFLRPKIAASPIGGSLPAVYLADREAGCSW